MGMTRAGRLSSSPSKNSSSTPVALRENTLKLTPPGQMVAPRGELRPVSVTGFMLMFRRMHLDPCPLVGQVNEIHGLARLPQNQKKIDEVENSLGNWEGGI